MLYDNLVWKYSKVRIFELYRKILKQMNILFAKLGHEEYELHEYFNLNDGHKTTRNPNCESGKMMLVVSRGARKNIRYRIMNVTLIETLSLLPLVYHEGKHSKLCGLY